MKRTLAAILTLVLLFALFPAQTTVKAAELGDAPFYCVNFTDPGEDISNVYWLPFFWAYPIDENTEKAKVSCYGTNDPEALAEVLKNDFNSRPKGSRYFQLCLAQRAIHALAEKAVYFDKAVAMIKDWLTDFLKMYKEMGGELDGIIIDTEFIDNHYYYLYDYYAGTRNKEENKYIYRDIVEDPRYETQLRPLLEKYGFKFYEDVGGEKSEIWCINYKDTSTKGHESCAAIWNHATDLIEVAALNDAVLYPLLEYYPDANVSNYVSSTQDPWQRASDNHGGEVSFVTHCAGNVSNANLYVGNPENSYYGWGTPVYNNPPSYNDAQFQPSPFNVFMYDVNNFKNMYASTDDGKIDVWHANYDYGVDHTGYPTTYCGTPYYAEVMLHVGLLNPQVYLGYMIYDVETACEVASDIMLELTRLVGASDRKPLNPQASWNGSYVLSGMYAAGRNVWRLTPDTDVVSLKNFKISKDGEDPTFYVDGLTIKFPGGKIVSDGSVREVGTCGYWIETAKDVEPVITATDDRYRNNPTLLEDFEKYSNGASFTSGSALPKTTWKVDGTAKVRLIGNNKALELTGDVSLENVKLPENITAGDEYAKQQGWEVTVTLPQNLNDVDSIKLLSYGDYDRGVRLSDGKAYYHNGSAFKEIEGVSLVGGATYTVRRALDFRTGGNYTCIYSVYDADGKLLGQTDDVSIRYTSLPIESINISVESAEAAVLIDNYKLYPMGVTTTLALYDNEIGAKVKDVSVSRTEDTAYRMTWLNATNEDRIACIYDKLSGDVIQEVEMKAGLDGVVTGVVEISSGKTMQLALMQKQTSSTDDNENNDNNDSIEDTTPVEEPSDATEATEPTEETTEATQPSTETNDGATQSTPTTEAKPSTIPDVGGSNKTKLGTGAIIAIIVSAVIFAAAAAVVLILILRKRNTAISVSDEEDLTFENSAEVEKVEDVSESEDIEESVEETPEAEN